MKFKQILKSEKMTECPDFGIYGDKYLYCSLVSTLDENKGIWSWSDEQIEKYKNIFETSFNYFYAKPSRDLGIDLSNVDNLLEK